jgi:nucleotide-binding universal stress UspA family protein
MKQFTNILCVVAPGQPYKPALERAVTLAENNQANLTVVAVAERVVMGTRVPKGGPASEDVQAALVGENEQLLGAMVEPYLERVRIASKVLVGVPFLEIIREVLRNQHDLVIKVTEAADWLGRLFGSDDMHLLRKCPCPTWLVKAEATKPYRRIVAAVDVSEAYPEEQIATLRSLNEEILTIATSLALAEFSELHVVHAWDAPGESAMRGGFMRTSDAEVASYVERTRKQHADALANMMRAFMERIGPEAMGYLKPETHLVKGAAHKQIPLLAKELQADLIVMGTVARTGIPGFIIGNTAETILNQIECSVLAIKPPNFVSPVIIEA